MQPEKGSIEVVKTFAIQLFILVLFNLFINQATAAEWYVSPSGTSGGDGSINDPWDLQTALDQPASVLAGDIIWLRGGTYSDTYTSSLTGTSDNPIILRQYSDERATIDGGTENAQTLTVSGTYTYYWGFEIMRSDTDRVSTQTGSDPTDIIADNGGGIWTVTGSGNKFINLIIHDTGQGYGFWQPALNGEVYGNIIYYNGWQAPDRGHGHGIYTQNRTGTKLLKDNIIFNQAGWGIHAYANSTYINNYNIQGNILFNNGALSAVGLGYLGNLLLGGDNNVAINSVVSSNYTYLDSTKSGGANQFGYNAGCDSQTSEANYFAHGASTALDIEDCTNLTMTGNTLYGSLTGFTSSDYPDNAYHDSNSRPTKAVAYVRPNSYDDSRGHIVVYNWGLADNVAVDVSSVLDDNQTYEVIDVENYFGDPIASGIYTGDYISIPLTSTSVATPVGLDAPPHTSKEFGAFVLIGGDTVSGSLTPTLTGAITSAVDESPVMTSVGGGVNVFYPTVRLVPVATGRMNISGDLIDSKLVMFEGEAPSRAKISIRLESKNKVIPGIATADQSGKWSWMSLPNLKPGYYTATFSGQDIEGNAGTSTLKFSVGDGTYMGVAVPMQVEVNRDPHGSYQPPGEHRRFINTLFSFLRSFLPTLD